MPKRLRHPWRTGIIVAALYIITFFIFALWFWWPNSGVNQPTAPASSGSSPPTEIRPVTPNS